MTVKMTWTKTLAACLLGSLGLMASASAAQMSSSEIRFMEAVGRANAFEVKASALAQQRAQSNEVKALASTVVERHRTMNDKLQELASSVGVSLPVQPDLDQQRLLNELGGKSAAAFDRLYIDRAVVAGHEELVRQFKATVQDAGDKDLRNFAANALPTLQSQLKQGRAMQQTLEASQKAAPATPVKR